MEKLNVRKHNNEVKQPHHTSNKSHYLQDKHLACSI